MGLSVFKTSGPHANQGCVPYLQIPIHFIATLQFTPVQHHVNRRIKWRMIKLVVGDLRGRIKRRRRKDRGGKKENKEGTENVED